MTTPKKRLKSPLPTGNSKPNRHDQGFVVCVSQCRLFLCWGPPQKVCTGLLCHTQSVHVSSTCRATTLTTRWRIQCSSNFSMRFKSKNLKEIKKKGYIRSSWPSCCQSLCVAAQTHNISTAFLHSIHFLHSDQSRPLIRPGIDGPVSSSGDVCADSLAHLLALSTHNGAPPAASNESHAEAGATRVILHHFIFTGARRSIYVRVSVTLSFSMCMDGYNNVLLLHSCVCVLIPRCCLLFKPIPGGWPHLLQRCSSGHTPESRDLALPCPYGGRACCSYSTVALFK